METRTIIGLALVAGVGIAWRQGLFESKGFTRKERKAGKKRYQDALDAQEGSPADGKQSPTESSQGEPWYGSYDGSLTNTRPDANPFTPPKKQETQRPRAGSSEETEYRGGRSWASDDR